MEKDKEFLVKGSIINGIGLLTRVVSPFLIILLARVYPQDVFGLFVSFQALVLTLSRVAVLGLDKGLLWYVPWTRSRDGGADNALASALTWSALLSCLLFVGLSAAGWSGALSGFGMTEGVPLAFLLLMMGAVWPYTAIQIFASALDGLRLPQYRVIIALFLTTSLLPAYSFMLKGSLGDTVSLGAGTFLAYFTGFLLFIPVIQNRFPGEIRFTRRLPPPDLIRYSLPLAFSEAVASLLGRMDLWMILFFLGPEKAAVYAVMVTITNGLRTVRQAFDPLLVPIVSNLGNDELKTKLRSSFSYATNMVSSIQLLIACFILYFPGEILSIAGKDYVVETFAFAILLISNLANGFLGLNGQVLLGMGQSRFILWVTIGALALTAALNALLIPRFGLLGAALASGLVQLLHNLAYFAYVRFGRGLSLYEPHIYINAVLELGLFALFLGFYSRIQDFPLHLRLVLFLSTVLFLGAAFYLKRHTFSLRRDHDG